MSNRPKKKKLYGCRNILLAHTRKEAEEAVNNDVKEGYNKACDDWELYLKSRTQEGDDNV